MKNSDAPAVKREEEEECGKKKTAITGKNRIMIYGRRPTAPYR